MNVFYYFMENAEKIAALSGVFGGLLLLFRGVNEYKISNSMRKYEILKSLLVEFEISEFEKAKLILDDFIVDNVHINEDFCEKNNITPLKKTLRYHKGGIKIEEISLRDSFDALLDFFVKLEYLYYKKLISEREVKMFEYYLKRMQKSEAVISYIIFYYDIIKFNNLFECGKK